MADRWFTIRIELVTGEPSPSDPPRPGRSLLVSGDMTFRMLSTAIDEAFSDVLEIDWIDTPWHEGIGYDEPLDRDPWDTGSTDGWRSEASEAEALHIRLPEGVEDLAAPIITHAFTLADGTRITPERDAAEVLADEVVRLARLAPGETFSYEPDADGGWRYRCTMVAGPVEPDGLPEGPTDAEQPVVRPASATLPHVPHVVETWGALPEPEDADPAREAALRASGPGAGLFGPSAGSPWDDDAVMRLRRMLGSEDVIGLVVLLAEHDPLAVAHLVGPTLGRAAAAGHPGAREAVVPLIGPLGERGWPGDGDLADELAAAVALEGSEPVALDATPVDLSTLAAVLDGPGERGNVWRLEVATGHLIPPPADVKVAGTVAVLGLGLRPALDDLFDFVGLDRGGLAGRMADSAPRRVWDSLEQFLLRSPENHHRWTLFAQERRLGRARRWLAARGLRPVPSTDSA